MLLIFQERFAKQVEAGTKTCTIRKGGRWRKGMTAHIRSGSQWKHARMFEREVLQVAEILIWSMVFRGEVYGVVTVNGRVLTVQQEDKLSQIDGFLNKDEFFSFFRKSDSVEHFVGQWIIFSDGPALELFKQITEDEK